MAARGVPIAACALLAVSCADIPTKPLALVHVAGSVTDRDGAPVAGARLGFVAQDRRASGVQPGFATTDSTGSFTVDLFESRYLVHVIAPDYSGLPRDRSFEVRVGPRHARVDYRYQGYWVRARVLDPTGAEYPDARVSAFTAMLDEFYAARFDSADLTLLLPAGTYEVYAGPRQSGTGLPGTWLHGVPVGSDTTWAIKLAGDPLTGAVTGPLGAPIAGALLSADGPVFCSVYTDATGAYRMYLPPGVYGLALRDSPGMSGIDPPDLPFLSVDGPASYDISVSGVVWTATVHLSTTGDPVPDAVVFSPRVGAYSTHPADTTDAAGVVRFLVQPGRAYTIRVPAVPGLIQERWWSPVIAGADSTFDLLVDPAGTPAGGRPIP